MAKTSKPVINIDEIAVKERVDNKSFRAKTASIGSLIGSPGIGCMLHVVEPGNKAFPFHVHHQIDELFIILEGEGSYRFGDDEYLIRAGDICAAPRGGKKLAHQIINTGTKTLKYLGVSTTKETEVVEYPDSGKFAVISRFDWNNPERGGIRYIGRSENSLDYFDGER